MKRGKHIEMLSIVAKGLNDLKEQVVFLGGATIGLHITDTAAANIRSTDDVDCVVEISGRLKYYELEEKLRSLDFKHSMDEDHPICRWKYGGILVDVMPTDEAILGFSNKWYKEGIKHAETCRLPDGLKIKIFSVPYLLASKIEAFYGRGKGDFLLSPDIEDILTLVDGCIELKEKIAKAPENVKGYIKKQIPELLIKKEFIECVHAHIESANPTTGSQRSERALTILKEINSTL